MDREAEIFQPRGTQNYIFDTLDCTRLVTEIEAAILLCFSFGALQHKTHTSMVAAKVVTLTYFPSSTSFDPDSYELHYNLLTL